MINHQTLWSAILTNLKEWVVNRLYGSTLRKQGKIKPVIIQGYLSGLKSYHVNHKYSIDVFDDLRLIRLLKEDKRLFPTAKVNRLLIIKKMLQLIIKDNSMNVDNVNLNAVFIIAWAGFLRLGEIIYTCKNLAKTSFIAVKTTRSDVSFVENDQYVVLRLKRSKIDVDHSEVQIMLATIEDITCLVTTLRHLFQIDNQGLNASLFRLTDGGFSRTTIIKQLKSRISVNEINAKGFSGHSFRKDAAQHASNNEMLDEDIQRLGR
jgi:hypothetical protein